MWELISSLINAGGSLIGSYLTNESNKELMKNQQEKNEEMMDKQNEYESPIESVKRAQAAGLNPIAATMNGANIFNGSRSASANPMTLISQENPFAAIAPAFNQMLSGFSNWQEGLDKKTTREARLAQIQEETNNLRANTMLLGANQVAQDIANQYAHAREQWALNGEKSKVSLNYAQVGIFNSEIKKMAFELANILPEEVKKLQSETGLNILRQDEVIAAIASLSKDVEVKESQVGLNNALAGQADANVQNLESQTEGQNLENARFNEVTDKYLEKYGAEIKKLAADCGLTEEQTYWYSFDVVSKNASKFMGMKVYPGSINNERRTTRRVLREYSKDAKNR